MLRNLFLIIALVGCLASVAQAGQGPQNVAVVINARSPFSMAVGHHYAQLRSIPAVNLIYLDWEGSVIGTDVETFREQILSPILKELTARKIDKHVTTVAYSADFPYVVDYKADLKEDSKVDPTAKQFHQASLTGLTYLAEWVLAKDVVAYTSLGSNRYYRPAMIGKQLLPTRSFPPGKAWDNQGETDEQGSRYLLSIMLAYTSGRGNSLSEVEHYLEQSQRVDGTYPAGSVYFLRNSDVRARTREPYFHLAATLLASLGVAAENGEGVLPRDRGDVMGAMIGAVDYRFTDSGSMVRGGAICENLTSFGGIMREDGGQTALSECLRAGAAGSSGTITEPYAIQAKFPHPLIHVHYARGSCLAEAFYQAVQGPYQLLIVGDPLAKPWATLPHVQVDGLPSVSEPVRGMLTITPRVKTVADKRVSRFELYVDGLWQSECDADDPLTIDTATWSDGPHEFRVVAYEDSLVATQGALMTTAISDNHGAQRVELSVTPSAKAAYSGEVEVIAASPGARELVLTFRQRVVGTVEGEKGKWKLPASQLGMGMGEFQVAAKHGSTAAENYVSNLVALEVVPPELLPAVEATGSAKPGVKIIREGKPAVVVERLDHDWLQKAGIEEGEAFRIESVFNVEANDLCQFQFDFAGDIEVLVDGKTVGKLSHAKPAVGYVPISLAAGNHRLEVRAKVAAARRMHVSFGNRGTQVVTQTRFQCVE